jgi:hypothetical protein
MLQRLSIWIQSTPIVIPFHSFLLVTKPEIGLFTWYIILTLFNLGLTILLFASYALSKCNI